LCIWLVLLQKCITMYGSTNVKKGFMSSYFCNFEVSFSVGNYFIYPTVEHDIVTNLINFESLPNVNGVNKSRKMGLTAYIKWALRLI